MRGITAFERLSTDMGLHLMEGPQPARASLQGHEVLHAGSRRVSLYTLQGPLTFASAERVVRAIAGAPQDEQHIALDLTRVSTISDGARRLLLESIRRLTLGGHQVSLIDHDAVLVDPDVGDGIRRVVVSSADDLVDDRRRLPWRS